jgi:multidrug efflux pump subunit AcrA (membrane-fusion protein)
MSHLSDIRSRSRGVPSAAACESETSDISPDCQKLDRISLLFFRISERRTVKFGRTKPNYSTGRSSVGLGPGRIAANHVEAGQSVKAGDLLFELEPDEARADALTAQAALDASLAEVARRRYAIDAVRSAAAVLRRSAARQATRPFSTPLRERLTA